MKRCSTIFLLMVACLVYSGCSITDTVSLSASETSLAASTTTVEAVASESLPTSISTLPSTSITATESISLTHGTLRLWVPSQFDPAGRDPAAELFQAHLDQFVQENPGWQVDVRVKAVEGTAGLLESLLVTSAAASQALPDLIALPRSLLESAVTKGLLRPFDGLTSVMTAADWYDYSRELARIQNNIFGLPFSGDALVLIYRSSAVSTPLETWQQLNATGLPLAFPVADPKGLFTLNLYQGAGGTVMDGQGQPMIDDVHLTQILTFTLAAERAGVMPNWLGLYETYDQTWDVYQERRAPLTVNWASRYLRELPHDSDAALLPSPDGSPFSLATGWVWALVSSDPERQLVAASLAEFLVDGNYLAKWCPLVGYLPTRSTTPDAWPDATLNNFVAQVVIGAHTYPATDIMDAINPLLGQAMLQVFKLQVEPEVAAQQAVEALETSK